MKRKEGERGKFWDGRPSVEVKEKREGEWRLLFRFPYNNPMDVEPVLFLFLDRLMMGWAISFLFSTARDLLDSSSHLGNLERRSQ